MLNKTECLLKFVTPHILKSICNFGSLFFCLLNGEKQRLESKLTVKCIVAHKFKTLEIGGKLKIRKIYILLNAINNSSAILEIWLDIFFLERFSAPFIYNLLFVCDSNAWSNSKKKVTVIRVNLEPFRWKIVHIFCDHITLFIR